MFQGQSAQADTIVRARVTVQGRVQGVGFRYHTRERARVLKISGYVRNQWDGTVLVEAEGEPPRVRDLISWLRRGPGLAFVSHVSVLWIKPNFSQSSFEVRY